MAIIRGDSEVYTITLKNADGTAFNLTDCTVWVTAKSSTADADTAALYQHRIVISNTGTVTSQNSLYLGAGGATAGILIHRIAPAESDGFAAGSYVYDVQVRYPSPDVAGQYDIETPILGATETVVEDITRSVAIV